MSEVQVKDSGGGGKNKQKKQTLRVDFTPMVDMNMLLITFFMFCTTLLKPQTMNINMPSKDNKDLTDDQKNQVRESGAVTVLLGGDNELFYYEGLVEDPKTKVSHYDDPEFLKISSYEGDASIEKFLKQKNEGTYELIQDLKKQLQREEIPDTIFTKRAKAIQKNAMDTLLIAPTVMIKATEFATYKNLVDVLDQMLITNIGAYAVIDLADGDRYLLFKKTGNPKYLTEAQRAEGNGGSSR
jgi:biopolymer transport protein ExbD